MNSQAQPVVNAASLDPEELAAWLSRMSRDAEASMQDYSMLLFELNSAERSLRYVSENLATRINFLSAPEIIRSAGHSTAIQEGLNTLRVISAAVRDTRQTILSSIAQFQQTGHQTPVPDHKAHLQGYAEQESAREIKGQ